MRKPAATILLLLSLIGNSFASDGIPDNVCEDACSTDYSGTEQKICSVMCRMGPAFASSEGRPISTGDCPELVVKTEHRKVCRTGVQTYLSYTAEKARDSAEPRTITLTKQPSPPPQEEMKAEPKKELVCSPNSIIKHGMCYARPTPKYQRSGTGNALQK